MTENTRHFQVEKSIQTTQPEIDFAASHAVVIGINDYTNGIPRLSTAVNDARRLAEILRNDHAYVVELRVEDVTRARLVDLFTQTLPQQVGKDDRLLVYFAGHGIALDGEDGPAGYLIPQDAKREESSTFLAMTDIHSWLSALPCRHLLAIMDCCFAGAFRWASMRDVQPLPMIIYRERYERFIRDPAWQVITSAAYDQKALDFLKGDSLGARGAQGEHSPFAAALYKALAGAGDLVPKDGGDGVITASELYLYLRDEVEVSAQVTANHRQTPGLWPLKKHDKGEFIFLAPGKVINLPPAPELTAANNPYRGLASYNYNATDARLFFGRTSLINELAVIVDQQPLTIVLGASGTGKSSLVKAGLLPKLHPPAETATSNGSSWHILSPIRPTDQPLSALNNLLHKELRVDGGLLAAASRELAEDKLPVDLRPIVPSVLPSVARWFETHPNRRLLLVIDQCEELITLCRDDQERASFLDLLAQLLRAHADQLRLVFTLRSDFEPQFAHSTLFRQYISEKTRFIVPPLSQAELREVIEGPATANTLFFEDGKLVDDLINEVVQTPGALPLLSFTLEQLYLRYLKRQEAGRAQGVTIDRSLTRDDYQALGGVIGSLNRRATDEYDHLPDDAHRATLQRVMLRMVAVEGGELARRRVALAELKYPSEAENRRVKAVLDALVETRLVVRGQADGDGDGIEDAYVEPAHDALVRAWDKLLIWKRAADEYLPLQRRLTQAANEWVGAEGQAKTGLLWNNNPRLGQLQHVLVGGTKKNTNGWLANIQQTLWPKTTVTNEPTWLNQLETEFVQASVARRANVLKQIVWITVGVIVTLSTLTLYAFNRQQESVKQTGLANQRAEAEATARADADAQKAQAVRSAATAVAAEATAVAQRNEAQRQARNSRSNQLAVQAQAVMENNEDPSGSLALLLARSAIQTNLNGGDTPTAQAIETLRLVVDQVPPYVMSLPVGYQSLGPSSPTWSVYNHDGTILAISKGSDIDLINPQSGKKFVMLAGHTSNVYIGRLSPTADILATSSGITQYSTPDYTVRLWDLATGKAIFILSGHTDDVQAITFSPSGQTLVTASKDKTIRFWDVATGKQVAVMDGFDSPIQRIEVSSDGKVMMTTDEANSVTAWDAQTRMKLQHFANVRLAASNQISPSFALASIDRAICLWNPTQTHNKCYASKDAGKITSLTMSQNGNFLAYATADHRTHILNLQNLQTDDDLYRLENAEKPQFSPDNSLLTTIADVENTNNYVEVWDLSSGKRVARLAGHKYYIDSVTFSPDSQTIVTTTGHGQICHSCKPDDTLRIWDLRGARQKVREKEWVRLAASNISHDGRLAVIQSGSSTSSVLGLWRTDTREPVHKLRDSNLFTKGASLSDFSQESAAFSPDDQWVAANNGEMVALWQVSTGIRLHIFKPYSSTVASFAFYPNRPLLLIGATDGTSHVYNWETGKPISTSISLNESLSQVKFSPDGRYLATCGKTIQLWAINHERPELLMASPLHLQAKSLEANDINCDFIQFSPDSKMFMAQLESEIPVWNLKNGQQVLTLPLADEAASVCDCGRPLFSPNSKLLATITSQYPGIVTVWDIKSGQAKYILKGHVGQILALAFSPDSKKLVSAGGQLNTYALEDNFRLDWAARLWDLETGQLIEVLEKFQEHRALTTAVFSADGKTIYTTSDGTGVIAWPIWEDLFKQSKALIQRSPRYLREDELREFNVIDTESMTKAQELIDQAKGLGQTNHLAGAHELVDAALKLNPYLNLEALNDELARSAAEYVYEQGRKLASTGDTQAAIQRLTEALSIYPTLGIDPKTEVKKLVGATLAEEGNALAEKLEIEAAIMKYSEALKFDQSLNIKPKQEAERLAFYSLLNKWKSDELKVTPENIEIVRKLVKTIYTEFEKKETSLPLSMSDWNDLCWNGALAGFAASVLDACEKGVTIAPEDGPIRDSRGLARALTGDAKGALEDFKFFVEANPERDLAVRKEVIRRLEAGEDPVLIFDKEMLKRLKNE